MKTADARALQSDLKKRGVNITLAVLRLLTVGQARDAMALLDRAVVRGIVTDREPNPPRLPRRP